MSILGLGCKLVLMKNDISNIILVMLVRQQDRSPSQSRNFRAWLRGLHMGASIGKGYRMLEHSVSTRSVARSLRHQVDCESTEPVRSER